MASHMRLQRISLSEPDSVDIPHGMLSCWKSLSSESASGRGGVWRWYLGGVFSEPAGSGLGYAGPCSFSAKASFLPFSLFLTECLSFWWLSTYFFLFMMQMSHFSKKKQLRNGISETALEIVMKNSELEILIKIKWLNLSEPQSLHLFDGNNNAVFVSQEMVKKRWENITDTNCKLLLLTLFLFF